MAETQEWSHFDGWTVEYREGANGRHEFLFRKEHDDGKDGKLTVWATVGADNDPEIAYLAGKRDAYAEDVRVSSPDDTSLWQGRFDAAQRDVVAGKVRRRLAKGFETPEEGRKYAIDRLSTAGFTLTEMGAILGEE